MGRSVSPPSGVQGSIEELTGEQEVACSPVNVVPATWQDAVEAFRRQSPSGLCWAALYRPPALPCGPALPCSNGVIALPSVSQARRAAAEGKILLGSGLVRLGVVARGVQAPRGLVFGDAVGGRW